MVSYTNLIYTAESVLFRKKMNESSHVIKFHFWWRCFQALYLFYCLQCMIVPKMH